MIKFGTDGWRGRIADDFTFENVRVVSQALADYLNSSEPEDKTVIVGYDRRFLSEAFARTAVEVLAANGFRVRLFTCAVPTPQVSFRVLRDSACAGVVITASHNPPEYNGFKIKAPFGGSATTSQTAQIEARLFQTSPVTMPFARALDLGFVELIEPAEDYLEHLGKQIDIELIKRSECTLIVDSMHGTGNKWIEEILAGGRCRVITLRAERDAFFGGVDPEPVEEHLTALANTVCRTRALLGVATDGDADRVAVIDDAGKYVNSHQLMSMLLLHLAEKRALRGSVVKTFSQSVLIDRIASDFGLPVRQTPIGFKYIAEYMLAEDVLIGGEESGGIGICGHLPERDGIFNALLLTEAVLVAGVPVSKYLETIWRRYGRMFYRRHDLHLNLEHMQVLLATVETMQELAGEKVVAIEKLDGIKLWFADGSWLLLRASGTEPKLRLYCEATTEEKLTRILSAGQKLVLQV
ncbi:MAG: phosphoglucomutase/phosphomannomutase family protein [Acidobacteriota bacterium]|nr:phosphoglucomutase/phosphomannomutase family protein [Blastocatellia bacterium]MDW8413094.1 phosphoglucomutase/phosphomannomutase family protein [Acidobacteriota bacterium]